MKDFWDKHKFTIIIVGVLLVILMLVMIYLAGRKAGKKTPPKQVQIPEGVDIPSGWTPRPVSQRLYEAMDGWGTDEETIWDALESLNDAQLALVYNDYAVLMQENEEDETDLFEWFKGDLSGDDLSRALNYFNGVV